MHCVWPHDGVQLPSPTPVTSVSDAAVYSSLLSPLLPPRGMPPGHREPQMNQDGQRLSSSSSPACPHCKGIACVLLGTTVWLCGFPSSLEGFLLHSTSASFFSAPCHLPRQGGLLPLNSVLHSPSEQSRDSAKSRGFHRFLLATHRNLGTAAAFSYSSKSPFSLPFNPISSRGTFHVSYHMVHSRQLARDGMHMVNSLFLLTHLRVPFYSFQPYRVSLSTVNIPAQNYRPCFGEEVQIRVFSF